jgi:hypothetical protein
MPTQPLSDEVLREAWQAVRDSGSVSGAVKASGIPRNTLDSRLTEAMRRLGLPHPVGRNWRRRHSPRDRCRAKSAR